MQKLGLLWLVLTLTVLAACSSVSTVDNVCTGEVVRLRPSIIDQLDEAEIKNVLTNNEQLSKAGCG